ncbi:MAG: hypothetical protein COT89_02775 [Candidatus Colwellbacteria bacterium CG10_big_fil_rev_8_21_14_0_10_42_22]|uniref:Uncharacterized protein n=1 Tax=Candidatus Colwellbacteria bacterium CG10_big_fil_rev_8_21_14_0_10_42_22 TaxID=1974540 RepID=A0A2H0VHI4_9BACT|nr:MAG: hypothetical protein COT89_02775 [Candidatus Colwellbacteria bacterium CG10_big_fil_rev_8_21_14_0_10_42_22]
MDYLSPLLIAGFAGGVIRGLVGFTKHQFAFKESKFDLPYFFVMVFISGIVGFTVTAAVKGLDISILGLEFGPALAFVTGYAGGDFIENLYKILFKTDTFLGFGE